MGDFSRDEQSTVSNVQHVCACVIDQAYVCSRPYAEFSSKIDCYLQYSRCMLYNDLGLRCRVVVNRLVMFVLQLCCSSSSSDTCKVLFCKHKTAPVCGCDSLHSIT